MKTTAYGVCLLAITCLAGCGGGGGGSSNGTSNSTTNNNTSSGSSNGSGSSTSTANVNNGPALLAAYTPSATIQGYKQANYATAFSTNNTNVSARCAISGDTSTTVYVTPNFLVYATTAVSDKAQALAADLAEQSLAYDKSFLGLSTSTVGYRGNKIDLCVDDQLGADNVSGTGGESGQGSTDTLMVMSADSSYFGDRYPNATSFTGAYSYGQLFQHELIHVGVDDLLYPFSGGFERWFNEGLAQVAVGNALPAKATVMSEIDASDLITASASTSSSNFGSYDAYQAIAQYVLKQGTTPNGVSSVLTLITNQKAAAKAVCQTAIPNGVTPPQAQTDGMDSGYENSCYVGGGGVDTRVVAAFDTAWNQTMKDGDGTMVLYLHTADSANSLESTVHDRLNAYLQ